MRVAPTREDAAAVHYVGSVSFLEKFWCGLVVVLLKRVDSLLLLDGDDFLNHAVSEGDSRKNGGLLPFEHIHVNS